MWEIQIQQNYNKNIITINDAILKAMNRHTTKKDILILMRKLRSINGLAIRTTFIVGFPGETDEDFAATLDLVRRVRFDSAFCFKYSPRPGTPASKAEDNVPETIKDERLQALLELLREQSREGMAQQVGKSTEVLIESKSPSP